jgi:hypothetical protein
MHHQLAGPGLLHRIGDFKLPFAAVPARRTFTVTGKCAGTASRMAFAPR